MPSFWLCNPFIPGVVADLLPSIHLHDLHSAPFLIHFAACSFRSFDSEESSSFKAMLLCSAVPMSVARPGGSWALIYTNFPAHLRNVLHLMAPGCTLVLLDE